MGAVPSGPSTVGSRGYGGGVIRRALSSDAAPPAELAARTFRDTFGAPNRAEDLAQHLARAYGECPQRDEIADPNLVTLVAEHDGALVAFAQLRSQAPTAPLDASRPIELWRFYLDTAWHGRGLAQDLMAAVLGEARAMTADALWLGVWEHNARAQAFYRRQGFSAFGAHTFLLGEDAQRDVLMVRRRVDPP